MEQAAVVVRARVAMAIRFMMMVRVIVFAA
jgi:hypothetical protein